MRLTDWTDPTPGVLGWRTWRIVHWAAMRAYTLGLISGSGSGRHKRGWVLLFVRFRGKRVYILGLKRERWAWPLHRLRYGHWPVPIWMGCCGRCAPWPCCGAEGFDHAPDCGEA